MQTNDFTRLDNSPSAIREYLSDRGMAARKRWGQNFLLDAAARKTLLQAVRPTPGERIWEIGPGLGAMTAGLLEAGPRVTAFEVDHGMVRHLLERFGGCRCAPEVGSGKLAPDSGAVLDGNRGAYEDSFCVVAGDAVKTVPAAIASRGRPDAILGNLPYNAAAPILWAALTSAEPIPRLVCTVQYEVAQRMVAPPGSKDFGPFAVLCSLEYESKVLRKLPAGCFYPRPHVESSVVLLEANGRKLPVSRSRILSMTDSAFAQPRKTLSNNLKRLAGSREAAERRLQAAGVGGAQRPSELSLDALWRIAEAFSDLLP